jgi:hypothetical protein
MAAPGSRYSYVSFESGHETINPNLIYAKSFLANAVPASYADVAAMRVIPCGSQHPSRKYRNSGAPLKCLQNSIATGLPLVFGFRMHMIGLPPAPGDRRWRVLRLELELHVWNKFPDGRWFDTTPEPDSDTAVLIPDGPSAPTRTAAIKYLKTILADIPFASRLPPPTDENLLTDGRIFIIEREGALSFVFPQNEPDLTPAQALRLRETATNAKMGRTQIFYTGAGVSDTAFLRSEMLINAMDDMFIDTSAAMLAIDRNFCWACSKPSAVQRCAGCRTPQYCNRECQKVDWPLHKRECNTMDKKQQQQRK